MVADRTLGLRKLLFPEKMCNYAFKSLVQIMYNSEEKNKGKINTGQNYKNVKAALIS